MANNPTLRDELLADYQKLPLEVRWLIADWLVVFLGQEAEEEIGRAIRTAQRVMEKEALDGDRIV